MISFLVSVLDGPLIQRASSVTTTTFEPVDVDVQVNVMNTLLPANFSGYELMFDDGTFTPMFRNISRASAKRGGIPLSIDTSGKNTTCVFKLPDPGFDVSCTEESSKKELINSVTENTLWTVLDGESTITMKSAQVFGIHFSFYDDFAFNRHTKINVSVSFKQDPTCAGRMFQRNCTLRPAMVQYPVILRDGVATVDDWRLGQNETLEMTRISDGDAAFVEPEGFFARSRDVSLDPFEIARAMGAPVLQDGSSNSRIDIALSDLRCEEFRYGEVLSKISDPWAGADHSHRSDPDTNSHELLQYDTRSDGETTDDAVVDQKPRLGLDRAERVGSIRQGVLY
ncbi:hypothetical protein PG996_008720 [Apiospora saccharicola]|uniref:Uncharacterized protein n=1 Tax=Apiospora saccharicola TaxID=335842 RepID=A0ABR1V234_9PEZI